MIPLAIDSYCRPTGKLSNCRHLMAWAVLWLAPGMAWGQSANPADPAAGIRATHVLGLTGAKGNTNGTLSIADDSLQFQKQGKPAVQLKISSIQDIVLGEESKQVGGTPMMISKAAIPFGGGRAVSLFAHKKYETLTVEYVDAAGGFHGAIFELNRTQAEGFRDELVRKGARVNDRPSESTGQSAEVASEKK